MTGDPLFSGLRGQSFQVHGTSDEHYAVISTPALQVNALFELRTEGDCSERIRQRTACWSHTGNYFAAVTVLSKEAAAVSVDTARQTLAAAAGIMTDMPPLEPFAQHLLSGSAAPVIAITAGKHDAGMSITLASTFAVSPSPQWQAVAVTDSSFLFLYHPNADTVVLLSSEFVLRLDNSDRFLNVAAVMTPSLQQRVEAAESAGGSRAKLADATMPHGLLGQTWSSRRHSSRLRVVEGDVDDYVVAGAEETRFPYSRY